MKCRYAQRLAAGLLLGVASAGCGDGTVVVQQTPPVQANDPAEPAPEEDSFAPRAPRISSQETPDAAPGEGEDVQLPTTPEPAVPAPDSLNDPNPMPGKPVAGTPAAPAFATPTGEPDIDAPIPPETEEIIGDYHDDAIVAEKYPPLFSDRNPRVRLAVAENANYVTNPGPIVDPLIRLTRDPRPEIRLKAVESLGSMSEEFEQVVPVLADALFDPVEEVSKAAAYSIYESGPRGAPAVPKLIEFIGRDEPHEQAIAALGAIGPAARPAAMRLIELLDGSDDYWRGRAVAEALGRLGEAAPLLERAERLADANDPREASFYSGLGHVVPTTDAIVDRLTHGLSRKEETCRYHAILALGAARPTNDRIVAALGQALRSESEDDRSSAASRLGEIDPKLDSAFELLLVAANDPSTKVKDAVADSLAEYPIDTPERLSRLLDVSLNLADENRAESVAHKLWIGQLEPTPEAVDLYATFVENAQFPGIERSIALDVLGQWRDHRARATEIADRVLSSPEASVDEKFAAAVVIDLENDSDSRIGPALLDGLANGKVAAHRADAAEHFGYGSLASERSDAALIAALDDASGEVRAKAAKNLGERALVAAVDPLIEIVRNDEYISARSAAAAALGQIGAPARAAVPVLLDALHVEDMFFPEYAAVAAARIGVAAELDPTPIVARLTEDLSDENWSVSDGAALALAEFPPETMAPSIPALIETADRREANDVSSDVQEALRAAGPLARDAAPVLLRKIALLQDLERWTYVGELLKTLGATQGSPDVALPRIAEFVDPAAPDEDRQELAAEAATALAGYGEAGKGYLPKILSALELPESGHRSRVVESLGLMGPTAADAVPALKKLVEEDPNESVQDESIQALLRIAPDDAEIEANLLEAASDDEHPWTRSFRNLELEERIALKRRLLKHEDATLRLAALRIAGEYERLDYLELFNEALDHGDAAVRSDAALALSEMNEGNEKSAAVLLGSLDQGGVDAENADRILGILSQAGSAAKAAIASVLADENRDEALRLLLARKMLENRWNVDRKGAKALLPTLDAENPELRGAAALLLIQSRRYPGGAAPLIAALRSTDPERSIASRAAAELVGPLAYKVSPVLSESEIGEAKEALFERIEAADEHESVRDEAAVALATYPHDEADRARILKLLQDETTRNLGVIVLGSTTSPPPEALEAGLGSIVAENYHAVTAARNVLNRFGDTGAERLASVAGDANADDAKRIAALGILADSERRLTATESLKALAESQDVSPAISALATLVVESPSEVSDAAIARLVASYPLEDYAVRSRVDQFVTDAAPRREAFAAAALAKWQADESARTSEVAQLLVLAAPDSEEVAAAVVERMRKALEDDSYNPFEYTLSEFGDAALPALIETLESDAPAAAKASAVRTIHFMAERSQEQDRPATDLSPTIPALNRALESGESELSVATASALIAIEPSEAAWKRIGEELASEDVDRKRIALQAIATSEDPPATLLEPTVATLGNDELIWATPSAIAAFEEAAAPHVPTLIAALDDEERFAPVVSALAALGPVAAEALPKLLERLEPAQHGTHGYAITAIDPKGEASIDGLRKMLGDPDRAEAAAMTLSFYGAGASQAEKDLLTLLDSDDAATRMAAVYALNGVEMPSPETIAKFLEFARNGREERNVAITAIGNWKAPDAVPLLIAALDDPNPGTRTVATLAVAEFGPDAAAARSKLRAMFDPVANEEPGVRSIAIESLASIGLEDADLPLVVAELESPHERLRISAIDVLSSVGPRARQALEQIERIYQKSASDSYERERAGAAIRAISPERADELGVPLDKGEAPKEE